MWVLFFILITSPGQFEVHVLETYKTITAEKDCTSAQQSILRDMKKSYSSDIEKDTFSLVCLKQKELEA